METKKIYATGQIMPSEPIQPGEMLKDEFQAREIHNVKKWLRYESRVASYLNPGGNLTPNLTPFIGGYLSPKVLIRGLINKDSHKKSRLHSM